MSANTPTKKNVTLKCKPRTNWLFFPLSITWSIGVFFLAYWLLEGQFYKTSHQAYVSGNVVNILPPITGHLTEVFVKENDLVVKGEPVAAIDEPYAYFILQTAETKLAEAIQQVNEWYRTIDQFQAESSTLLKNTQAHLRKTQAIYKRNLALYEHQDISREALQQAQIAVEKAADEVEEARLKNEALASLSPTLTLYQHPNVIAAMDQLRSAYLNWRQSTVYAPETGYIVKRQTSIGDAVKPNTALMTMVPLNQMWVDATIKKSELKNIYNGQKVKLTSRLSGSKIVYDGTVLGLSPHPDLSLLPAEIPLRIHLNDEQLAKHPLPMGFTMTATINTHDRRGKTVTTLPPTTEEVIATEDYREQLAPVEQLIHKIVQDNTKSIATAGTQLGRL